MIKRYFSILLSLIVGVIAQKNDLKQEVTPETMDILCGDVFPYTCQESRYRSINASCNNLLHPTWAMPFTRNLRLLPADYADGIRSPRLSKSGHPLPLPRKLSTELNPNDVNVDKKFTLATMQMGQVIAHDLSLVNGPKGTPKNQCCSTQGKLDKDYFKKPLCYPLIIPKDDPGYKNSGVECLFPFLRTITDLDSGCSIEKGAATQLTVVTHVLDLSLVYGSNDSDASLLRRGKGGSLRFKIRNNQEWPPTVKEQYNLCNGTANVCYRAGDSRINQNPQLTVLQIVLFREHNRIAKFLAKLNSHWSDEKIFQETRRIMIAVHQSIIYHEWLPLILGLRNCYKNKLIYKTKEYVNDYDPLVNPGILNEFASAAFRSLHTLVAGNLKLVKENRQFPNSILRLGEHFFNATIVEKGQNYNDMARGLFTQPSEAADKYYDKEITLFLGRVTKNLGTDLRAFDIQRGRDHGLRSYIEYRTFCGLPEVSRWDDLLDLISPEDVLKLSDLYETPADVDLTVGASLEKNVPHSLVGPTFHCLLTQQFLRTRIGDRYWYENGNSGTPFTRSE
ncbi:peroxidase-like [Belonocnema kinseyi]|uniref:peroxidase-like n=1 Tax=Belonocnema kinseyi TaxID=2817044 RepID=UPI00143D24F7|nr:peroxidase-like [Belonocnema kinseyi]